MSEAAETSRQLYQEGKNAFERGNYREAVQLLEKAAALSARGSFLGGEIQTWLVTAYDAAGQRAEAIALCRQLVQHPSVDIGRQNKRLLYILEAPNLNRRPEWLTEIPDLNQLQESDPKHRAGTVTMKPEARRPSSLELPEPGSTSSRDNTGFIWVALIPFLAWLAWLAWLA
ncbi:tetratricopeptide repeat protein [Leptolyngbya sp. FACHB-261]|uniref:tetratricopeptide repeat protein n=1 Tax=Leptolyngbya sp. FACHB-261 TaxID=2692806 RepID=UPI00168794D6|nr:tetratricopeptide repeat protein [Leptolyngbya sp. FACHB-261]MBD2103312.1 tetratricopeptide repeat protein [Leptolyngbya sp. FACHB-261]